jgi:hypothetical protein
VISSAQSLAATDADNSFTGLSVGGRNEKELLVDQEDPGASCTLSRLTLQWLAEMMKERAGMEKRIRAGLAQGEREPDLKAQARRLLGLVGEVREAWEKAP